MKLLLSAKVKHFFGLILGPLLFFIICCLPIDGLEANGKIVLALYVWVVFWWITKPVPWSLSSLLPLIVIPVSGALKLSGVAELYGQRILFFLIGVLSLGMAFSKYGLGNRLALTFLSGKRKTSSIYGIILRYLLMVMLISSCVDDAAAIAICIPTSLSICQYVCDLQEKNGKSGGIKKLQSFLVLGTLYAAEAGGIMSIAGIPHIPVALSILEETTGISLSFWQWSKTGIIIGLCSFAMYFLILKIFFKPEVLTLENADEIFTQKRKELNKLSKAELYVIAVFVFMMALWLLPNFVKLPFIDVWIVPVFGALLLYAMPNGEGGRLLDKNDFAEKLPWDTIFLILGGGVMASLSTEFGLVVWLQSLIPSVTSQTLLLFVASISTAVFSNFVSGTAAVNVMANIFLPIVHNAGLNSIAFAFILPASGMAIMFPWAGAATGTTFSTGKVDIKDMIKSGFIATILHITLCVFLASVCAKLFY